MMKLYLINLIISLALLIIFRLFRSKGTYTFFFINTMIPFLGFIITFAIVLSKKFLKSNEGEYIVKKEEDFKEKISLMIREAELKNKEDLIPVEDAFELNKDSVKRKLVKDILKKDTYKHLDILIKALGDEDTETSHYAATAITGLKGKLTVMLQEKEVLYNSNRNNKEIAIEYMEILEAYINSKILDQKDKRRLTYEYINLLKNFVEKFDYEEKYINNLILKLVEVGNTEKALEYINIYMKKYEYSERPYLLELKVFYILNDKKNFFNELDKLRNSDIKISKEGLETLRFWI